ncbi:MAG: hypothetical protein ACREL3_05565 [Gemmatimonadales bacterium]
MSHGRVANDVVRSEIHHFVHDILEFVRGHPIPRGGLVQENRRPRKWREGLLLARKVTQPVANDPVLGTSRDDDPQTLAPPQLILRDQVVPSRALLMGRGLEYLNRLSRQSQGDPGLRGEIAQAYIRLGIAQGNSTGANLGTFGRLA